MPGALDWLVSIGLALALAACAGLRAWLPLFGAGLVSRLGIAELGPSFEFLGSTPALVAFGTATAVEMVADKLPVLDHALDAVSTVIRPAAGALVAAAAFVHIDQPLAALVIGLLTGAPAALATHAAKASTRLFTTTTTGGLGNTAVSTVEDGVAISWTVLAFVVPVFLAAIFLVLLLLYLRRRGASSRGTPA